ncbi:MAG: hypothetical protein VYD95_03600, partial [Pseudomonadota bacterium]|nr:hypothetical protein [Pseudomonadota bacterium]
AGAPPNALPEGNISHKISPSATIVYSISCTYSKIFYFYCHISYLFPKLVGLREPILNQKLR